MRITQYIPDFADVEPKAADFETLEELLAIPWVKHFARAAGVFCWSHDGTFWKHLMVDYNTPKGEWWVIGSIPTAPQTIQKLGLPEWRAETRRTDLHR